MGRRVVILAVLLLAATSAVASPAPASAGVLLPHGNEAPIGRSLHVGYARFGSDSEFAISGVLLGFNGDPAVGAQVDWGWWTSRYGYHFGGSNVFASDQGGTGKAGTFSFRVTGGHHWGGASADDLRAWYKPSQPGLEVMEAKGLNFSVNNNASHPKYSYQIQPAELNVALANAPAPLVEVAAGSSRAGFASSSVTLTGGAGVANVLPMANFDDVVAYYYHGRPGFLTCPGMVEGLWSPTTAVAGQTVAGTFNLDWKNAQYARLAGPACRHSGKPGSYVTVELQGWPAGEEATFASYFAGPGSPYVARTSILSHGPALTYQVRLRIYPKAPVGVDELDVFRSDNADSLVDLWDYYQVCTIKASAASIRTGQAVRLSGKVPGSGSVVLLGTTHKVSGQPLSLAARGWRKLGVYRLKSGKFATGQLRPKRTTWYVVRYSGYAFPAFTSVVKVVVR